MLPVCPYCLGFPARKTLKLHKKSLWNEWYLPRKRTDLEGWKGLNVMLEQMNKTSVSFAIHVHVQSDRDMVKLCYGAYFKRVVFNDKTVEIPHYGRQSASGRAGKINQIARCDWLPERARWSHLARSGLPAVTRMKNFPESHIINLLLTKFVRSRWLDIGLVFFLRVYGPRLRLGP